MRLIDLEIENYRSIKSQVGSDSIELEGLDCLVGKNNAGKTNILSAIRFLLEDDEKDRDTELYWNLDSTKTVEVRGYFEVDESDLDRISDDEKRNKCKDSLISRGPHKGQLGICRIESSDGVEKPQFRRLAYRPVDDNLSVDSLVDYRNSRWEDAKDPEKTYDKADYARDMRDTYGQVAELVPSDKYQQKKIWVEKLKQYIESNPDDVEFSLQPAEFKNGTKQIIREVLLPKIISIPAIREVSSATKRGGEFGNLIQQIQSEIQDELDARLHSELPDFDPREYDPVIQVEKQISEYVEQTFQNQSVKIGFPQLSTDHLFRDADIKIQENHLEELSKENVGEGVKRTVIFSLLRTLADLQAGELNLGEEPSDANSTPYLVLYEEAELFLHPSLQQRLLRVLRDLASSDSQVVFSTHSPVMIQNDPLDTINIVRKHPDEGSVVTQFHEKLDEFPNDDAERARLIQMERVSSYIFSDQVVLVEGVSDRLFIRKVAPKLNENWDFDEASIPVLDVGGKRDVRIFYEFLNELDIETHCVFDIDAILDEIPKLVDEELNEKIEEFIARVKEDVEPEYSADNLSTEIRLMPWTDEEHDDAFEHIEDLLERIQNGDDINSEDAEVLTKILARCEQTTPQKNDYASSEYAGQRRPIIEELLAENILLLSGEIEDYFPAPHGDKRKHLNGILYNPDAEDDITCQFEPMDSDGRTDVEMFLEEIFDT